MKLRDYQLRAVEHVLEHPRCALWLPCGAGKTIVVLRALETLNYTRPHRALIVAPRRVAKLVWPAEIEKWGVQLSYAVCVGTQRERLAAFRARAAVTFVNFENVEWLQRVQPEADYDVIIVDESSKLRGFRGSLRKKADGNLSFRSGSGTRRSAAIAKLGLRAPRVIEMTGTPAPNGIENVWAQHWYLDFGCALGFTFSAFHDRWFRPGWPQGNFSLREGAEAEIRDRCKRLCLSIRLEDYVNLCKPLVNTIRVELPPAAMKLYKTMKKDAALQLDGHEVTAVNAGACAMKLLQCANGFFYDTEHMGVPVHTAKLDALEEIIEEQEGEPLLVAYSYREDARRIEERFGAKGCVVLRTDADMEAFADGKIRVGALHPARGGHGLNLAEHCAHIVHYGPLWDLELMHQVVERIGPARQAQLAEPKTVRITRIVAEGTLDEGVFAALEGKASAQQALLDHVRS